MLINIKKYLIFKMKFIFKLLIFFLLIISFIYGVYIGIVDNNYIHDKKRLLLNGKTIASYYLKRLNYSIDKINIDLSKENERLIQRQIDKAIKNKNNKQGFNIMGKSKNIY